MAKKSAKEYRALIGMNYPNPKGDEGDEIRVEAGDKIRVIPDDKWLKHHLRVKDIEEWVPRQTENVHHDEDDEVTVQGVRSRHANHGEDIVLKDVSE